MQLYMQSVGRGATFLLNVPPDNRGLLHENNAASLREFGKHFHAKLLRRTWPTAQATASNTRGNDPLYGPEKLLDDDRWSAWVTDDAVTTPEVVLMLAGPQTFNLIRLREDIRLGQRVEGAAVDAWDMKAAAWKEIARAESIGACRLWRVPATTTTKVRIRVTKSPVCPALSDFGLFLEPAFTPWSPTAAGRARGQQGRLEGVFGFLRQPQ